MQSVLVLTVTLNAESDLKPANCAKIPWENFFSFLHQKRGKVKREKIKSQSLSWHANDEGIHRHIRFHGRMSSLYFGFDAMQFYQTVTFLWRRLRAGEREREKENSIHTLWFASCEWVLLLFSLPMYSCAISVYFYNFFVVVVCSSQCTFLCAYTIIM